MNLSRWHHEYVQGVDRLIGSALANGSSKEEICCPCRNCVFNYHFCKDVVKDHLIANGFVDSYEQWVFHGEPCDMDIPALNDDSVLVHEDIDGLLHDVYKDVVQEASTLEEEKEEGQSTETRKFYKLVEEGQEDSYTGCKKFSKLSFTIQLHILTCLHGLSNEAFDDLLKLLKEAYPDAKFPASFNEVKKVVKAFGFDYHKLHACLNYCMLYWKDHSNASSYHVFGASRWKTEEESTFPNADDSLSKRARQVPAKVLWHFPLKPRLQRLFMCSKTAELMAWYQDQCSKDGNLRHLSDREVWKAMDLLDPNFAFAYAHNWAQRFRNH